MAAAVSGSFGRVLVFSAALALFAAPGCALAGRWFSGYERHAAGIAIGFFLSTLVASFLYRLGALTPIKLGFAIVAVTAVMVYAARRPKVTFRQDGKEARLWLVATLAVAMSLVALPYLRIGQETAEGVDYRTYFSADLMTHLSIVGELQKGDFPPQNPFYGGHSLGYQWLFFLFPALVGGWIG
ncbi:MAG: hypothetical protein V3U22_04070, partial [Vicinamibacteria bacterium]